MTLSCHVGDILQQRGQKDKLSPNELPEGSSAQHPLRLQHCVQVHQSRSSLRAVIRGTRVGVSTVLGCARLRYDPEGIARPQRRVFLSQPQRSVPSHSPGAASPTHSAAHHRTNPRADGGATRGRQSCQSCWRWQSCPSFDWQCWHPWTAWQQPIRGRRAGQECCQRHQGPDGG